MDPEEESYTCYVGMEGLPGSLVISLAGFLSIHLDSFEQIS